MAKALPEETRQAIIKDLLEGRLDFEEIAKKHSVSKGQISKMAAKQGASRKKKKRNSFHTKVSTSEPATIDPIKLETFGPEQRLLLIDTALSQLKAILPKTNYSKGMNEWTSSAERLMNLRREEEPDNQNDTEDDGYLDAVRSTAREDWADAKKEACSIPVEASEQETEDGPELVDA